MQSLLLVIKRYRTFLLFIVLELVCIWLIFTNNRYQNAIFFNSSKYYNVVVLSWSRGFWGYFELKQVNARLAEENKRLQTLLSKKNQKNLVPATNSKLINKYNYILAGVVNNSTNRPNNYITIDKGKLDGIEPGMGIISASGGVVGKVKACSNHFSTVISLLHSDMRVSALIKNSNELGSVKWNGRSPKYAKLLDVSSHLKVKKGDTVVTSGYNAIFPPQIPIGVVSQVGLKSEETFYDIDITLTTGFNSLNYVYVIKNLLRVEQETLEKETFEKIDE